MLNPFKKREQDIENLKPPVIDKKERLKELWEGMDWAQLFEDKMESGLMVFMPLLTFILSIIILVIVLVKK